MAGSGDSDPDNRRSLEKEGRMVKEEANFLIMPVPLLLYDRTYYNIKMVQGC